MVLIKHAELSTSLSMRNSLAVEHWQQYFKLFQPDLTQATVLASASSYAMSLR